MDWIELDEGAQALRPAAPFEWPRAWREEDISPADWTIGLSKDALGEIDVVLERLRRQQLPICMLTSEMFALDACRETMERLREQLDNGIGVALLDRLPIERWSSEQARAVCWLLGRLLSQPVAQEWNGLMFRDIHDEGGDQEYGNERAVTSRALTFHTDNSGNRTRPDYVSLMCLSRPLSGGQSEYCTVYSVYNALASDAPNLLERLFEPFLHDRQGIQTPGEAQVLRAPVLTFDGACLRGRFSLNKISQGYRKAALEMDETGRRALAAVVESIERDRLACNFTIEPGQVQYINNLEGLHHRTDYVDGAEPGERRHLVRVWYRNNGQPFFDG